MLDVLCSPRDTWPKLSVIALSIPARLIPAPPPHAQVYYWDTYWVLKGLLASNLTELSEDIIGNFIHLISTYGHVSARMACIHVANW